MRPFVSWLRRLSRPTHPIRTGRVAASRPPYVEALESRLLPTTYVVTTAKDVLGDTAPGEVTLRDALTALDGTPSGNARVIGTAANTITFKIPGIGPRTINVGGTSSAPNQPLPAITRPVFLDGWSQGGAGYHKAPLIVLNGAHAGDGASGLVLSAGSDGSTVRGLVIQQFSGDGIDVNGTRGNLIAGNYLGSNASGTAPVGNAGDGILIRGGAVRNTVGGTAAGASNLISEGALASGVEITGPGSSGNLLLGNLIGTDVTGKARLVDTGDTVVGVLIHGGATDNTVGGTAAGARNLIAGNATQGDFPFGGAGQQLVITDVGTTGNVVLGNLIGTDITGAAILGKYVEGVVIEGGAAANTVGGAATGAANVISGNSNGVEILDAGTSGNVVLGNLIGTDRTGTEALGNSNAGVEILDASDNTIGGTAPGATNVISGNDLLEDTCGMQIVGAGATGNVVVGNYVGTDAGGTVAMGNGGAGILLAGGATANTIGGTVAAAANVISGNEFANGLAIDDGTTSGNLVIGNLIGTDVTGTQALGNNIGVDIFGAIDNTVGGTAAGWGNVISGNAAIGVVCDSGASGNVVLGNRLGTDVSGTAAVGNTAGVFLGGGATANTIGGTDPGAGNLISGNGFGGVGFGGATGNVVLGNLIGTDVTGTAALGNGGDGVYSFDDSSPNTIGGTAAGAGNVISANAGNGLMLTGGDSGFVVLGNLIGTDVTGAAALGNAQHGILIGGPGNVIGGTAAGAGNVISANGQCGVAVSGVSASGNVVQGNLIGTDITGTHALGNADDGVLLDNSCNANTVGGTAAGDGNVISGNGNAGVRIGTDEITTVLGIPTSANVVLGNHIGTDLGGTAPLGNGQAGVRFDTGAAQNTLGGTATGSGNVIAFNGKGVVVADAITTGDSVLGNSIFGNAEIGIDLGDDGPTANGPNPRTFPNDGQNAPALTAVGGTEISGTLSSTPSADFRLEFFASAPVAAPAQGRTFLGWFDVSTDAAGNAAFDAPVAALLPGTVVTATATDLATGDTSEFSPGVQVPPTVYVVTTTRDILGDTAPGELTLRDALTALDGTSSGNAPAVDSVYTVIEFAIPGTGPQEIDIGSDPSAPNQSLPAITRPVLLDGWSQGGAGYLGPPLIVLNGADAGSGASGVALDAGSDGSTIRGLVVQQFDGDGLDVSGTSGNLIAGNYLGTDVTGTADRGNASVGVYLNGGATANTVGGTAAGAANVLSANHIAGVALGGSGTSGNLILGNLVGTDVSGTAPLRNGNFGLFFFGGGSGNTVGGTAAGAANVISANGTGVFLHQAGTSGNLVLGNLIGTDRSGTAPLGNGWGVLIADGAIANTVGGTAPGAGNVLSANQFNGVEMVGNSTSGNAVLGNLIGTDFSGRAALGNSNDGVRIDGGATGNTVGGTDAGAGNVISGNGHGGVEISGATGNLVAGNNIGTDITGLAALGNVVDGVDLVGGAVGNTVGGAADGARNVISANGFQGVSLSDAGTSGNVVAGNYIGTDAAGAARLGNASAGVYVHGVADNTIGGVGAGNVISASGFEGVLILGAGATGNVVAGNRIGTDAAGGAALGNSGDGVRLADGAAANTVGGTAAGAGNVISANGTNGLEINASNQNVVQGNLIGTDATGSDRLGNTNLGAWLNNGATANTVGGPAPGAGNVISANGANGLEIDGGTDNIVQGNLIGTGLNGTAALGNVLDGVFVQAGSTGNLIGGAAAGAGNVVSSNGREGVEINAANRNMVQGNLIGADGTGRLGNTNLGVWLNNGATGNTVGGTAAGAGNVISGNGTHGVEINGSNHNVVQGNLIGTDASGTAAIGNTGDGVFVFAGSTGNTVGGTAAGAGNVISANGLEGVEINGSSHNLVQGNLIGTDVTGTAPLGNTFLGVWLNTGAAFNTVGGAVAGAGNVISGNGTNGLEINASSQNVVQGNLIGTDVTGTVRLGNGPDWQGLLIFAGSAGNTVGGTAAGAGNVITGGFVGLYFYGAGTSHNVAVGNLIGTDKSGTRPLSNFVGVAVGGGAAANTLGGAGRGAGNVISANSYGVDIFDTGSSGNAVLGNFIGTDRSGRAKLGNANDGVILEGGATANSIGGTAPGSGNAIAFNGKGIVLVDDGATGEPILGDSILGNRLWGNAGPGIDLGDDGPTPNGPNPRALPNHGQNAPVITALTLHSVSGRLTGVPRTRFRIEFFATPAGGPAYQGQTFLGFVTVTTSAAGAVSFTAPVALPPRDYVTATATNLSTGDTSEFSPAGTQLLVLSNPVLAFSPAARLVTLSAQILFAGAPVTSGVVVFRVAGVPGSVVGRVNANGVATVSFLVPAGTSFGAHTITATSAGAGAVPTAVGEGLLTVAPPPGLFGRRWL